MIEFKDRLEHLKNEKDIKTISEFARLLDLNAEAVRSYLKGRNLPDSKSLYKIAKFFADKNSDVGEMMVWLLMGDDSGAEKVTTSGISAYVFSSEIPDEAKKSIRQMLFDIDKLQDPQKTKKIAQVVKILSALPEKKVDTALNMVKLIKKEKTDSE